MAVRVHDLGGDRYDLVNTGTRAIDGVTISLPSDATAAKVDGRTVTMSNHQIILPNLAPRKTVRIELGFSISFVGE
jgi:hypothetical protein